MDRVIGVFILVTKAYLIMGGQPRASAEGYIPGRMWIDGSKVLSIEPLAPPAMTAWYSPGKELVEHVCTVVYEGGTGEIFLESEETLLRLCNEAKKNAEEMRIQFAASYNSP